LYRSLAFLAGGVFANPDDAESGFLVSVLDADQISRSQRMFEPFQERAPQADVPSRSAVIEGSAVGVDAPNTNRELAVAARFSAAFDHGSSAPIIRVTKLQFQ
jgi:hypothetical protein